MKNILFATSEAVPFIKTGGLAMSKLGVVEDTLFVPKTMVPDTINFNLEVAKWLHSQIEGQRKNFSAPQELLSWVYVIYFLLRY